MAGQQSITLAVFIGPGAVRDDSESCPHSCVPGLAFCPAADYDAGTKQCRSQCSVCTLRSLSLCGAGNKVVSHPAATVLPKIAKLRSGVQTICTENADSECSQCSDSFKPENAQW